MPQAPDAIPLRSRRAATRRGALVLIAILIVLTLGGVASYLYNQLRQDIEQKQAAIAATGGDPGRGRTVLAHFGCGGCHMIPGIANATGQVGPELGGIARRVYVAGVVTNTPDNLIRFIVDPKSVDAESAMPRTGIDAEEARDVAAYLYSLRQ
jgi:cytochrome c2